MGKASAWVFMPLAATALASDVLRARSAWYANLIRRFFGAMMRVSEFSDVPGPVIINGGTWICCTAAGLVLIFPSHIAALAVTIHLVGDAVAALAGRALGRRS